MRSLAVAALATALLAHPVLAEEPSPPSTAARGEGSAKPVGRKPKDEKKTAAEKRPPKSGKAGQKEAPCEPVKPCAIE
jgi:hypothetical protein